MWFTEVNNCIIRIQCSLQEALHESDLLIFEYMDDTFILFIYYTNEYGMRCVISKGDLRTTLGVDNLGTRLIKKFYEYEFIFKNWQ